MKAKRYSVKLNPTYVVALFSFLIFGFNSINAQCPTVTDTNQSFCDLESLLVSDLQAVDNGGGVFWYDTAVSTTPLSPSEGLVDGEDYYADDNTGNCGPRTRVDVTIYGPPTGQNFQGVCLDDPSLATVADLQASGNDVQWYLTASGGLPLDDSTVLIDNTIYYADQANPDTGCRTSRLAVLVNVGFTPIPTGDAIQEFCFSSQFTPTVGELEASGLNNWYISLFSAVPLDESTPLVNGQTYYATTIDPPCESTGRFAVTVTLIDGPDPGTSGTIDICETDTSTYDLFDSLGGSPELGGTWSPALASGTGVFDPSIDAEGIYTYTVSSTTLCPDASSTVTVSFLPQPDAGTNGTLDLCSNNSPVDLFDSLGGTPEPGGIWSPALSSGTGIFDPSVDTAGVYTYTITGTPPCLDVSSTVTVAVATFFDAGEDGTAEVCNDGSTIDLFNSLGGTPDVGGTWSPALASGTGVFDPTLDAAGVYTYAFTGSSPCPDDSATVTVTINESPDAGTNGSVIVCSTDTSIIDLFDSLGGTPDTGGTWSPALVSGTGIFDPNVDAQGTYTYTVIGEAPCPNASASVIVSIIDGPNAGIDATLDICDNDSTIDLFTVLGGTPDTGGIWSPTLTSGTGIFDPSIDPEGIYTYTVTGVPPCDDASATVTISIIPFLEAGEDGAIQLCTNDEPVDLFDSLGGIPEIGGTWSPALVSGTGVFDPSVDTAGTYTYTTPSTPPCTGDSAEVVVSLEISPDAGANGTLEICDSSITYNLFDSLGGTPDTGGVWSPTLASGTDIFDPNVDVEGIYAYTISSTLCGDVSSTVTVTIEDTINPGENGTLEICITNDPVDLFDSLGGTPDPGGVWSPSLASGNGIFDPNVDVGGTYTYTVNSSSGSCPSASATITVTVSEEPDAGTDGTLNLCGATNIVDLFDSLGGTPDSGGTWSPTLTSGTGIFDPNIDPEGTYTYTVSNICGASSATVAVSFTDLNDAGTDGTLDVCSNDDPVDLFNSLGGTPQPGGDWSPALVSGTSIFDPNLDSPGVYTYTISNSSSNCPDSSATVTVNIIPAPTAGIDGNLDICTDDLSPVDLFVSLGGTPDLGGTWSPALASGTGIFDPNVDAPGEYIYTVNSTECNLTDQASVIVSIGDAPNTLGLNLNIDGVTCFGDDIAVEITGANQLTNADYDIVYELSGANAAIEFVTVTITDGNGSFTIPSNLLPNTGSTILTITEFYFSGESCSAITSLISPIEIFILDITTPTITIDGNEFCEFDDPTVADLTENVTSSGFIIWYNQPNGGTPYFETDPLQDGVTYYASLQNESGCESTIRLAVTVNFTDCELELIIPDGFSPNGDTINDDFHIVNLNELYPNFKLTIYNRYGNLIYEGDINTPRWDGTSKKGDNILPVGVYFYILEFNDNLRESIQGRVYLNR